MKLYNNTGERLLGNLENAISATVEEERNGNFELILSYPIDDDLHLSLEEENIIVANANDTLKDQKFVIYKVSKYMQNQITVYARHISFDLMHDILENEVSFENQSCEYALNEIFRNSISSKHYRGYSNIVNTQKFKVSKINCLSAIAGTKGSVIDTFGTGAEILRDNTNIHVLNRRGRDNDVSIEYRKNLTGLKVDEDTSELVTRIKAYATQRSSEGNETIVTYKGYIDAPNINKFSKPFSKWVDYSDKFEQGEEITEEKLKIYAEREYTVNKVHIPKCNYKLEFIPLSKVVGYEGLEDKISLCDTVTIKDTRYNINTKAKVIKTVYNVLLERYDSIELGEPRTTLGNIISGITSSNTSSSTNKPDGDSDTDDIIIDLDKFPDTLPDAPVLTGECVGFQSVSLTWTYENKLYYAYELYASKTKDFTPNSFDLIFEGQASAFTHEVNPSETWYYKACAKNTYGHRTEFSKQIAVTTTKIEDFDQYFSSLAVKNLVANIFSVDHMRAGTIKGDWIDAKNLSVTDGNGKRTLNIDSFGRVELDVTSLKVSSNDINNYVGSIAQSKAEQTYEGFKQTVEEKYLDKTTANTTYASKSDITQSASQIKHEISQIYTTNESVSNSFTDLDRNLQNTYATKTLVEQTANSITQTVSKKVGKDEIVSSINQTAEAIKIKANKIDLDGYVWVSTQLTAPHITGKVQMYMETGSIFSSDGEMNVKKFYGMPNGTFNVESTATFSNQIYGKSTGVFDGNLTCKAKLISNTGAITKDFSVGALLTAQNFTLANNASIGGTCYCNSQETTYDTNVGRNLVVNNNTKTKTLSVTGDSTLNALSTASITNSGNATIRGTLTAQNQTVNNNLTVSRNIYANAGEISTSLTIGGTVYANGNVNIQQHLWANSLAISGTKNCVQDTENFGKRLINAYETADYLFGDVGESIIENGECIVYLDDVFKETISTDYKYQVFITKYGKGDIWVSERHEDYFIVQADNDISFGWEIKAKRKGYENYRLEEYVEEIEDEKRNNTV
jgi:phage minor structural protein